MKAYTRWNHHPYFPYSRISEKQKPYICRLAPSENAFEIEWFNHGYDGAHTLFYAKRASGDFKKLELSSSKAIVDNLESYTDYEIYIEAANGTKSNTRLVRTGYVPGTVINYLHPEDRQYAHSGRYLCSPSIVRTPKGNLLASMDLFEGNNSQNITVVFRSEDNGESWEYVTDLMPCFWGSLFEHDGKIWMISISHEYGDILIGYSKDEGNTWSEPEVILRGSSVGGTCISGGPHKAPMPVIKSNGRILTAIEYGGWHCPEGFSNIIISADEKSDISLSSSWSISEPVNISPEEGKKPASIEGNIAQTPEGGIVNILRFAPEKATVFKADCENPDAPLEFEGICNFPMAHTKFEIRRHRSGWYYAVGNTYPARTRCAIYKSPDLKSWEFVCDVVNYDHLNASEVGFQYPSFIFDGDEMLIAIRTAFNLAHNFHDANYILFFKVKI